MAGGMSASAILAGHLCNLSRTIGRIQPLGALADDVGVVRLRRYAEGCGFAGYNAPVEGVEVGEPLREWTRFLDRLNDCSNARVVTHRVMVLSLWFGVDDSGRRATATPPTAATDVEATTV